MKITHLFFFGSFLFSIALIGQNPDSITWNLDLDEYVVTAQYAPTHSKNAVHKVDVIKAVEIKEQGFNNLAEVLTNELNLRVSTDAAIGSSGLSINGLGGQNIQIMIDGVPVIGRVNGSVDLTQINLDNVERIEVVKGALSAQYGSNASGGVVNIIKKKSQLNKVRIESRNQYENVGNLNNSLMLGTNLGKLHASVNLTRYHSRLHPDDSLRVFQTLERLDGTTVESKVYPWNPKIQYGAEGVLRYRLSDSTNVSYTFRYFDEEVTNLGKVLRPQFRPYANDQYITTFRTDHSLNFDSYLGSKFYLKSTTAYNVYDWKKETRRLDIEPDTTSLLPGGQDTSIFTSLLHRSSFSTLLDSKINGMFGVEVLHETGSGGRLLDTTSADLNRAVITNYAAWASLQYEPTERLSVAGTLRYGHNTKYDHPLVPTLNLSWKADKYQHFRASFAGGFRAPSLKELHFNFVDALHDIIGNPNLLAERSKNVSLDYNFEKSVFKNNKFGISTNLFYNQIENRIVLTEYEFLKYNYQNLDKFETQGINFQTEYAFAKNAKIKAGFSYSLLKLNTVQDINQEDEEADTYEFQNEFHYQIPKVKTNFVFTHRYIGRQIRFTENVDGTIAVGYLGDYHLFNASLSRDFWKKRVFVSLGAKNLLNTTSVEVTGQGGGLHNTDGASQLLNWGRTYFLKMNFVFE